MERRALPLRALRTLKGNWGIKNATVDAVTAFGMRQASVPPPISTSRKVPVLCKVAPAKSDVHLEDVHRAGGIMAILGELDRAHVLDTSVRTVHATTLGERPLIVGTLHGRRTKRA